MVPTEKQANSLNESGAPVHKAETLMTQQNQNHWIPEQNITWLQRKLKVVADKLQREALMQLLAREREKLKTFLASE